jgi:hypothetical protein
LTIEKKNSPMFTKQRESNMRPAAVRVAGIAALFCLLGPWTAVAQEEEGGGRDLEDILKDVVRDVVEEQGSSNLGRIVKVSVARAVDSQLNVDLEGSLSRTGRAGCRGLDLAPHHPDSVQPRAMRRRRHRAGHCRLQRNR